MQKDKKVHAGVAVGFDFVKSPPPEKCGIPTGKPKISRGGGAAKRASLRG